MKQIFLFFFVLKDLVGDTEQRYRSITFWVPMGFIGFGFATTNAVPKILEILSRRKQEERKLRNQDFKVAPIFY